MITATYDGSQRKIYKDGLLIGRETKTGAIGIVGTNAAYIGSASGTSEFFKGLIDDVKIYNRALSQGDVEARYKKDSLVGYWKFDDVGTTITSDYSGNGNNGTLTNMSGASSYVDGQIGKSLSFDGVNDYVSIGNPASLDMNTSDFSLNTWIKLNTRPSVYAGILTYRNNAYQNGGKGYHLGINESGQFNAGLSDGDV